MRYLIAALLFSTQAVAHDPPSHTWQYPQACCHDRDCRPVPCDQLLEQPNGSITYRSPQDNLIRIDRDHVHPSGDASCHICYQSSLGLCAFLQYGN